MSLAPQYGRLGTPQIKVQEYQVNLSNPVSDPVSQCLSDKMLKLVSTQNMLLEL